MREIKLMHAVQRGAVKQWRTLLLRNNVGHAWQGERIQTTRGAAVLCERRISYGLAPGSGDLIGISEVTITPDMVGRKLGIFTSFEIKTTRGRVSDDQLNFAETIVSYGGIAETVRDLDCLKYYLAEVNPRG